MVLTDFFNTLSTFVTFIILSLFIPINSQRLSSNTSNSSTTNVLDFSQSLIANIQSNGLRGYVLFVENNGFTSIRANILGSNDKQSFDWKVYGSSVGMSGETGCPSTSTSSMSLDLTTLLGPLEIGRENILSARFQSITGDNTLIGKTLVLRNLKTGSISCAIILPFGSKKIFEAKFYSPIEGSVYLIQCNNITGLMSSLSYSTQVKKSSANKWTLMAGLDSDATDKAKTDHRLNNCNSFLGRPFFKDMLTPGTINIGSDPFSSNGNTFKNIESLLSIDLVSVVYLIIYSDENSGKILSCAPIERVHTRTASAKFNYPMLKGSVELSQETPFDPTIVEINIELFRNAYSYGIDELPKIVRSKELSNKDCPNINSIIFNPRNIDPDSVPTEGLGTTDQYAVGDLSGKYGNLADKTTEVVTLTDFNLPLFGRDSVIGRALVFYSPEGTTIGCSNIEINGVNMTTAFATFDHPIQGQFIFRQPSDNCSADTYVYIEISKPGDDNATKTSNHPWKLHINQISPGNMNWSTSECRTSGDIFNPYNVSANCVYERDCTQTTPYRCQLGDMSSKLGFIDIPPYKVTEEGELDIGKYFFTDMFLPLCGPNNIISRSVIVYKQDYSSNQLSCANIIEYKPKLRSRQ
ncbi:uncharacterized protein LOC128964734 [Oppia nitens]|uniref:uncharacterized protein LOC128964734 n=1 Tax=Oppia nitens TaxID=1686743 RepID=UPI0023DBA720|nr:uncharacterized protein LOC128964734 [Oppia nitens]